MKKFFLHIFLVGVLGMLTVSCNDTEMVEYLDTNTTQVMFSLGMDSPVTRTRATKATDDTWGSYSPSDGGDAYDNRINPDQLYVKITHGGKTYDVKKILKWQDKDDASLHTFVGEVDIDLKGQTKTMENAKIEVFANWNPDAENGGVFSQSADYIPMWGVQTATITLAPGKRETLSTIYLLRAMAKIQVSLNKEMSDEYTLAGVTLNKHNAVGNCLPTGAAGAENTKDLGLEAVLNAKTSNEQTPLAFAKDGDSYVVYLPEVVNDDTSEEMLLKISVELEEIATDSTETGSFFIKDYSDEDNPVAIDIIRNHWYKYTVTGFAASQIYVEYKALDWQGVGMEIGGDGFLFLSKDVIEIYNSNISEGELKFASSSPIKSIVLTDRYDHANNGEIVEGTTDGVSAYYISKYGQKIQLGADPGFDLTDKDAALAREQVILSNIKATAEADVLNGGITITSPFLANPESEIEELKQNSHYDTPRYLEFLVTNDQNLTATFRVIQYPPVVITNEEGYFSYRDDQKYSDDQTEEVSHYLNYKGWKSFHLSGLMFLHVHEWSKEAEMTEDWWNSNRNERDYSWVVPQACPANKVNSGWDVVHYGNIGNSVSWKNSKGVVQNKVYGGLYKPSNESEAFVRWRYNGIGASNNDSQGLAIGELYQNPEDGKWYRNHYVWNVNPIFYNLYVSKVWKENGTDANGKTKLKGQADINSMTHAQTTYYLGEPATGWANWGLQTRYNNHRMYHVKTTATSDKYILGNVELIDKEGNITEDSEKGMVVNTIRNANLLSPSFMVASQLGETRYQEIVESAASYGYKVPNVGQFYKLAVDHCREYVETTINEKGEVTHYHDWRLPTKAEINMIIDLQATSRAMDELLFCQYYFCVTGAGDDADTSVKENWVSKEVEGYASGKTGYYIRCVRDVKPNENK